MCVRLRCAHVDAASGASANGIDNASAEWELGLALRLLRRVLNGEGWRCFLSSFFIVFVLHSSRMHFIGQGAGPKQWHSNWWHLAEHASALSPSRTAPPHYLPPALPSSLSVIVPWHTMPAAICSRIMDISAVSLCPRLQHNELGCGLRFGSENCATLWQFECPLRLSPAPLSPHFHSL